MSSSSVWTILLCYKLREIERAFFESTVAHNQSSEYYLDITTLFTCCSKYATKDGEAGLRAVLQMLGDELEMAMGMCGRPTI